MTSTSASATSTTATSCSPLSLKNHARWHFAPPPSLEHFRKWARRLSTSPSSLEDGLKPRRGSVYGQPPATPHPPAHNGTVTPTTTVVSIIPFISVHSYIT